MKAGVLFVSNGHGEDLIAARLAVELLRKADSDSDSIFVQGFALVGKGLAYRDAGIPVVSPPAELPSGGFLRLGPANLWRDVRGGILRVAAAQVRALRELRRRGDVTLAVAVGDVVPLALAGRFLRCPVVFLPTAKSDYIAPHLGIEVRLMRRFCQKVFARDELTAENLRRRGVPAEFAGNPMMDVIAGAGGDAGDDAGADGTAGAVADGTTDVAADVAADGVAGPAVVALLPGSRSDAELNLQDLSLVAAALVALAPRKVWRFVVPLAAGFDLAEAGRAVERAGWNFVPVQGFAHGLVARATLHPLPVAATTALASLGGPGTDGHAAGAQAEAAAGDPRVDFWRGRFASCLRAAGVVVGLAGTANEQAAGMGRPVVAFPGRGVQFTRKFLDTQKRLLGEALLPVIPDPLAVASEVLALLGDPARRRRMAEAGRSRMGPPGGTGRVAEYLARAAHREGYFR